MNYLKILGSSGNKSKNFGTTSFQISNDTTIDAGNIINSLDDEAYKINHKKQKYRPKCKNLHDGR